MRRISAEEFTRMRGVTTGLFMDRGKILTYQESGNGPYAAETYTPGVEIDCGFDSMADISQRGAEEARSHEAATNDAVARLPLGTAVAFRDRFQLTERHGVALSPPEDYRIIGHPMRGATCLVLRLSALPGNAAG